MNAFFKWLADNSFAGYAFITVVSAVVAVVIISFMTALIQGRTISYWPPQIGPKPDNILPDAKRRGPAPRGSLHSAETIAAASTISAMWTSPAPDAEDLLHDAKFSVLILGTSLFRIVNSDMFMYRSWLLRDGDRRLGLLFLNPHSPHAVGRERRDVRRSSQQSILESIRSAYVEASKHPQIIPAIYEGPFRYTARARDIGPNFGSASSSISIVTSSHAQGISKGFQLNLTPTVSGEPYAFYQSELMHHWMQSLADPPGHGISVVARIPEIATAGQLDEPTARLKELLQPSKVSVFLFDDNQFHVTISALCRTQSVPYLGPLKVGQAKSAEHLPGHFGAFLAEFVQKSDQMFDPDLIVSFARARIDNRGYVLLEPGRAHDGQLAEVIRAYRTSVAAQVAEYHRQYPTEGWSDRLLDQRQHRFGPKSGDFDVHVTIGRAFSHDHALPAPLQGGDNYVDLDQTISCPVGIFSIVHYAYRSLLRTAGSINIGFDDNAAPNEYRILQQLGIAY